MSSIYPQILPLRWTFNFECKKKFKEENVGLVSDQPSQLGLWNTLTASLQWSKTPPRPQQVSWIWKKLFDDEAPALEIWGMWNTPMLPLLPGLFWSGVVAPDRILSMGQIEQTVCKQMTDVKLWLLYSYTWNHLTVCKKELKLI